MIEFRASNWLWIALVVFVVAMHVGRHGCGTHGHHQRQSRDSDIEYAHDSKGGRSTS